MYNVIVLHILRTLFRLVHLMRMRFSESSHDLLQSRRVLLVMTTAVGDTLMCSPAVRSVRKSLPNAKISVLVDRRRLGLLQGNPHIDELIPYPGKFRRVWHLVKELRSTAPDLAIILHANDPDIVPLVYLSGAPIRVGWAESAFAFLLTHPVPRPEQHIHFIEHKGLILSAIGIELDSKRMEIHLSREVDRFVDCYLEEAKIDDRGLLVALHPFASKPFRWWPGDNVVHFLRAMSRHPEITILLLGGKGEEEFAERILRRSPDNVRTAVRGFSLLRLAALIARAHLFIGTDSGPLHIATALEIPRVGLFGWQLPEIYGSESDRAIHLKADVSCQRPCTVKSCPEPRCMQEIRPELVYGAAIQLLKLQPPTADKVSSPSPGQSIFETKTTSVQGRER